MSKRIINEDRTTEVRDLLEEKLHKAGIIRTGEAIKFLRSKVTCGDHYAAEIFRKVMEGMVKEGKALLLGNGKWRIL